MTSPTKNRKAVLYLNKMRVLIGFLLIIGIQSDSHAKIEVFSNLTESIRRKEIDGNILSLNGIATHRRFIFDVYRLSLYVINPSQDENKIMASTDLKYAEMQFLRDLSSKDLQEAFLDTFHENCLNDCETLKPEILRLVSAMPDMKEGEKVDFIFYPQKSVIRGFDNKSMEFDGPAFGQFFLRAWLGDNPPSRRFKRELLNLPS